MKNNISRIALGVLSALLVIGAIVAGTSYAGSVVKKNKLIDPQTAEEFAILDAGVEADDISGIRSRLEYKNGQYKYNITFNMDNSEYKYEIRAKDGAVISKEIENNSIETAKDTTQPADQIDQQATIDTEAPADTFIETTEPAETPDDQPAAEKPAPQKSANQPEQGQPHSQISLDQAKKTALDHAGLSENEVKFSSAKLENDDGKNIYDIEFYKDNVEYEYEINAVTNEIIDSEIDYD